MNRLLVILLTGVIACTGLGSAQARPPYPSMVGEYYKDNAVIVTKTKAADKCNLCHDPIAKLKKVHNEYGNALKKHLPADEFMKLKGPADKEKLAKKLGEALKATEADKHTNGKTFGEVIKSGKLPGDK